MNTITLRLVVDGVDLDEDEDALYETADDVAAWLLGQTIDGVHVAMADGFVGDRVGEPA